MSWFKKKDLGENRSVKANDAAANAHFVPNAISNTKYTAINFIPKNLAEQFSRNMNRYFLIIACLQLIKDITPVNPLTTWLPLAVIFGVTAVKEAIDDYGRMKADAAANSRPYTVVRGGKELTVQSREILVGDILKLGENDEVPADAVVLSTSDANGNCFIQTTNLDGESNLKVRTALPATKSLTDAAALSGFSASVECAAPNEHIYQFDSQLKLEGKVLALSASQLLLQATHIRNTDVVFGLVVYTGNETKFGKNKRTPPSKYTKTDGFINSISTAIFGFQLLLVIIFGIVGDTYTDSNVRPKAWYFAWPASWPGLQQLIIPARFLLLNSTMIPISLKLTLDLCKLFYAKFINADLQLYDAESDTPANSNSTALSEDLGQVKYVLTDKTGTLTENRMVLKVAVVGTTQYGSADGSLKLADTTPAGASVPELLQVAAAQGIMADHRLFAAAAAESQALGPAGGFAGPGALEFLRCLALNSDVVPAVPHGDAHGHGGAHAMGGRVYKASSPDEEALVKSAAVYSVGLWEREGDVVTIRTHGRSEAYTQLACFEFNSDRKRMSVLLRSNGPDGRIRLYIKGADDMIMARLAGGQDATRARVQSSVDHYAALGLRTLVYGYRDISEAEYAQWKEAYDVASAAMVDRDGEKEKVYALMEREVVLLGATAIEDKLQDGVPETIALLKQAGVSFWMLTGDKFSTALTIANTANLKPSSNELVTIEGEEEKEVLQCVEKAHAALLAEGHTLTYEPQPTSGQALMERLTCRYRRRVPPQPFMAPASGPGAAAVAGNAMRAGEESGVSIGKKPYTVIVRGSTIAVALASASVRQKFAAVLCAADSVIACRVTPRQKGQLVKLVKDVGHLTLAIGDGGNDVAMIQEAAVGVGIRGKEGLQASRAADYSVSFFRALQRLLLVHGRYSYTRTAVVAQYSFYKSLLFCFLQIGYGFFSGYAGVSMFNSLCVAAYNAVLFVPIVFFLVDRDLVQGTALTQPQAYLMCSNGDLMTGRTMLGWTFRGLWQAILLLLFCVYGTAGTRSGDYESLGLLTFMGYMWMQDFTMLFALRRVTVYNFVSIFGMHLFSFAVGLATNSAFGMQSFIDFGSFTNTIKDPAFWLLNLLTTAAAVLPVQAVAWWTAAYNDSFTNRLYRLDRKNEEAELAARKAGYPGSSSGSPVSSQPPPSVAVAGPASSASAVSVATSPLVRAGNSGSMGDSVPLLSSAPPASPVIAGRDSRSASATVGFGAEAAPSPAVRPLSAALPPPPVGLPPPPPAVTVRNPMTEAVRNSRELPPAPGAQM